MQSLLIVLVALAGIGVIAWFSGSRLPREHVATVQARYSAAPGALWDVIADPARAVSWRKDLKSVTMLTPVDGNTAWEEHSRNGSVRYVMIVTEPARRLTTRIVSSGLPFGGQWEFDLVPEGTGSMLTITERGFVNPPVFRLMARLFFGFTSTLESYHLALATKVGERAVPLVLASGR